MNEQATGRTVGAYKGRRLSRWAWLAGVALAGAAFVGCEGEAPPGQAKPQEVEVGYPIADKVADYEVFTGRTQAMQSVDIKTQVAGYLEYVGFKEGDDVKKGQTLFKLDSRPYDAALAQAEAMVNQSTSQLQNAQDVYKRDLASPAATPDATLIQDRDALEAARAGLKAAEAARQASQNNVDYCVIKADFDGRIGRRYVDPGNDVSAHNTVLATLVQLQPLYGYFDVDERTLLRIGGLLPAGAVPADAAQKFPLTLGLASENPDEFKHKGTLTIANNQLDATTGTLRMWGVFDNSARDLKPGLFVRVRMDIGPPQPALFVAESALGSDQGKRFLYVINDQNKAIYTQVDVGRRKNGLIAVTPVKEKDHDYTLTDKDRVVVNGLQRIHPVVDEKGNQTPMEVKPVVKDMPRATGPATEPPAVAGQK